LAVRQPWASLIIEGLKKIEIRTQNTKILNENVAIYAATHRPTTKTIAYTFSTLGRWEHYKTLTDYEKEKYDLLNNKTYIDYDYGKIIGTVKLSNSLKISNMSSTDSDWIYKNSFSPAKMVKNGNYIWRLEKPMKFSSPIPYTPPHGVVVWSKTQLLEGII
jgi:hypothetical protein